MIQIFDQSWKDHLYPWTCSATASAPAFAEKDPRIQYRRKATNIFGRDDGRIRDKVTDLIFRARIVGTWQAKMPISHSRHPRRSGGYGVGQTARS